MCESPDPGGQITGLLQQMQAGSQQAADSLLAAGATSGADAMAGFVGPYLLASLGEG